MATISKPPALDRSLNTTETPSRNIADVLAQGLAAVVGAMPATELANLSDVTISVPSDGQTLKYNSITQMWENANDAGGHVIEEQDGTDMTQRANLQFVDAHLTDDGGNDRTKVEIAKEVTEAAFDALNPLGNEYDGIYLMQVADAMPLTADMVGYDGGTVKGALDIRAKAEIVTISDTTDSGGLITITAANSYTNAYVLSNISSNVNYKYRVTVNGLLNNTLNLRYRNASDNSAVANTSISDVVMIIGF